MVSASQSVRPGSVDVELEGVVKRFGAFTAVDGIDLAVPSGRFVTLLGPSGCGKTTTLRMIGGLEVPDEGTIRVAGMPISPNDQSRRVTRMVFQNYALFPHMTAEENVAFGLRMQKMSKSGIATEVAKMVDLLGLAGQLAKYPNQMSGGQQQRVALARALVTRPRVLLLDEPLGALDLKMRKHMQNELKKLQREVGITFVYVTHDQEEALNLSDTVVVMDHGCIVQQGSPADIYQAPATAYVADFIGETNLIEGEVRDTNGANSTFETPFGTIRGHLAPDFEPANGDAVLISIRPEHIKLQNPGQETDQETEFARNGLLVQTAYLGSVSRLSIRLDESVIRVDVTGVHPGKPGDTVRVSWRAEHTRVLDIDSRFASTDGVSRDRKES
jgi:spermidine/putrescine transport system ATP-binding protein